MCGSLVRVQVSSPLQSWSPSSRGPGHRPFTAVTGVRIPQGTPLMRQSHFRLYRKWLFSSDLHYNPGRPGSSDTIIARDPHDPEQSDISLLHSQGYYVQSIPFEVSNVESECGKTSWRNACKAVVIKILELTI